MGLFIHLVSEVIFSFGKLQDLEITKNEVLKKRENNSSESVRLIFAEKQKRRILGSKLRT